MAVTRRPTLPTIRIFHRTSYLYGDPVVLRSHRLMLRPWESRDLRLLSSGIGLGRVGQQLANISSDFDPRTYSYRKLSDLVRHTNAFEMEQGEGRFVRIRPRADA